MADQNIGGLTTLAGASVDQANDRLVIWDASASGAARTKAIIPSQMVTAISAATAAQGAKADTALQAADIGVSVQAYDAQLDDWATKTAPSGTVVGTDDTQTLSNKTIVTSANTQTGTTYTLVAGDASKLVTLSNGSAIALTVPENASVAFAVGTTISLAQLGAGQVTIAGTGAATVNSRGSANKIAGQYGMAVLHKTATDTWLLSGDITT